MQRVQIITLLAKRRFYSLSVSATSSKTYNNAPLLHRNVQQQMVPLPGLWSGPVFARSQHTTVHKTRFQTLAFYKFHDLPSEELPTLREQLLRDFGSMGIVGRVYISTEGINAQLSCPEHQLHALQEYCEHNLKPKLGNELMDFNYSTEETGERAFRALHVRIRKQVGLPDLTESHGTYLTDYYLD